MSNFIVTGIDTNVGKTFVSAILLAGLSCDYWKPVQTGVDDGISDRQFIFSILGNQIRYYPERYVFGYPASPNIAAEMAKEEIIFDEIVCPKNEKLLVEGAGGLMVPLNQEYLLIDLFQKFHFPIVLVSDLYLGAINHTLLSVEVLKSRKMPIKGIIFNKTEDQPAMKIIEQYSGVKNLGFVPNLQIRNFQEAKTAFDEYLSF